jgi:hypothetical protein
MSSGAFRSRRRIAIVQSSYIPWKGYFDIVRAVDQMVFLDDAQMTKRDWRNRNCIKTQTGQQWLTVPVETKGRYHQAIDETRIAEPWTARHWSALQHAYARAPYFATVAPRILALYQSVADETMLSRVNYTLIRGICDILGIDTPLTFSREFPVHGMKTDRLLSICTAAGATDYLSGPAAASYLEQDKFAAAGIAVRWAEYAGYPTYPQLHGEFEHGVSIVDLLFNTGPEALSYMKRLLP